MVFSYYIKKYPYKLMWNSAKLLNKTCNMAVYIGEELDYYVLEPILKHLGNIWYIPKNAKIKEFLTGQGIDRVGKFCFPETLLMCRHATHRFPEQKIFKIGFRHGAYHFKRFAKAKYYNAFDKFFMTSSEEVRQAEEIGITCADSASFPKLTPLFDNSMDDKFIDSVFQKCGFSKDKKTILFTSTWDGSGMSAVGKWYNRLDELTDKYNVLCTLHPWVSEKYRDVIVSNPNIYFISETNTLPFMKIADVMVGDMSSIIAEFCALDKPIIAFKITYGERIVQEIIEILDKISIKIDSFDELFNAIEFSLANPMELSENRKSANSIMFDSLNGDMGLLAAEKIKTLTKDL